jgi:DNA-binding transcriptional regulator YiaG
MKREPPVGALVFLINHNHGSKIMPPETNDFGASERVPFTAESIRRLRQRKQLSVGAMAKILGVSPATLEAWESGRRNAAVDVGKLAQMNGRLTTRVADGKPIDGISIKILRQLLGLNVRAIAKRFRCSVDSWYSYEQGRRHVPIDLYEEIATKYSQFLIQVRKLRESI